MRQISFVTVLGGVGQTTLVANVATLLARRQRTCLALDMCPQNTLSLHLGLPKPSTDGWSTAILKHQWLGQYALRNSDGVDFLAFGELTPHQHLQLQHQLVQRPEWVGSQLRALDMKSDCVALLDAPVWPSALAAQAVHTADMVVVLLDVSVRACHVYQQVQALLSELPKAARCGVVLTHVDARRSSQRLALQTLNEQWREIVAPYVIHADESCPMSLAQSTCVSTLLPHAQSAHDIQGVAQWIEPDTLGAGVKGGGA